MGSIKLSVVGIGPGDAAYIIPAATKVLQDADIVIGYHYYLPFVKHLLKHDCVCIGKELSEEEDRAILAIQKCTAGKHVVVISSGDAGIYAMASLVYEQLSNLDNHTIEVQTVPGISAFIASAAKLGAPLGHDFCCISLSDLMTPWTTIENRIRAAAIGDFVTSLYNPRSKKRFWQLRRFKELFLQHRAPSTPVAIVKQVTRPDEHIIITTLQDFAIEDVDMFSLVMIGNSQTYRFQDYLITPRGYLSRKPQTGDEIQEESFRQIESNLTRQDLSFEDHWAVIRCIHSTADFDYELLYESNKDPIATWNNYLKKGGVIVTDVTMVQSGITKKYIAEYGNNVVCLLNDPDTNELAEREGLTRSQAAMQLAIAKYPTALFVVGNAPTALFEICDHLLENKNFKPAGVIAAPVGFVNVVESKLKLQSFQDVPYVIIQGRKGGSNVAASIANAAFTVYDRHAQALSGNYGSE